MNKILPSVLFFFLACTLSTSAQKINLNKKNVMVEYLTLPANVTLPYFDKYSTDFFTDPAVVKQLKLKPETINSFFELDGYQYTKDSAEFNYSIRIEKSQILSEEIITKTETSKNTDGTTKTVIKYIATSVVVVPTTLSIKLIPYGTSMYNSEFANHRDPIIYKSSPQLTRQNAQQILDTKVGGIPSNVKDLYIALLQSKIEKLKQDCCFGIDSNKVSLFTINANSKDTAAFGAYNKSVYESAAILEKIKYNVPLNDARKEMIEIITYWSECVNTIPSSHKHLKKLKRAYLFNIAICQFYLEYLDECEKTCQLLMHYNKNEALELMSNIKLVRESFKKSGLKSLHINRVGFNSVEHYTYTPVTITPQKKN